MTLISNEKKAELASRIEELIRLFEEQEGV